MLQVGVFQQGYCGKELPLNMRCIGIQICMSRVSTVSSSLALQFPVRWAQFEQPLVLHFPWSILA